MNTELQSQFQNVENALNALVDSISTYNASPQAARALLEADADLSKGLEKLSTHQSNYARILALRQSSDSLDAQIKSTLTLLSETRKELLSTPATTFPPSSNVPYSQLLNYAHKISKFTMPPTRRPVQPAADKEAKREGDEHENGAGMNGDAQQPESEAQPSGPKDVLPVEQQQWLDPTSNLPFFPWPPDDLIRGGALARIAFMIENGEDPSVQPVPAPAENADIKREEQAPNEIAKEEEPPFERRESAFVHGPEGLGSGAPAAKRKAFSGLDLYDPDDE